MTTHVDLEELDQAVRRLADIFGDPMTADQLGGHVTCGEAEVIDHALRVLGCDNAAATWLRGHAEHDDPGDLHAVCAHCDLVLYPFDTGEDEYCAGGVTRHEPRTTGEDSCPPTA